MTTSREHEPGDTPMPRRYVAVVVVEALIDEGAVPFHDLAFALSPDGGQPDFGAALEGVFG